MATLIDNSGNTLIDNGGDTLIDNSVDAPGGSLTLSSEPTDPTDYDGEFIFNESFSDVDIFSTTPNPVTWETDSPQGLIDWSWLTIAHLTERFSFGGAALVSPTFAISGDHGGSYEVGQTLTWMQPNGTEIARTVAAMTLAGAANSIRVLELSEPITTITPIPLLSDSSIIAGGYVLALELDRHLNRIQVNTPFSNANLGIICTFTTADKVEPGDSGKPIVALFGTQPVLVGMGLLSANDTGCDAPNPSYYLAAIQAVLDGEGEELTLARLGGASWSGSIMGSMLGSVFSSDDSEED